MIRQVSLIGIALAAAANGQVRTGGPYQATIEAVSAGGGAVASADYRMQVSVGGPAGVSSGSAAAVVRQGFTGQIFDPVSLQLASTTPAIDELGVAQLSATAIMDDGTTLALSANDVAWSIASGPLLSVTAAGMVTADAVYQSTPAAVNGVWSMISASLPLTVTDVLEDNFGSYAGDGLPDLWQANYFGIGNPLGAPGADGDGDGQDNRFEYLATTMPNDPGSRFQLRIEMVPGEPNHRRVLFSPYSLDRTYSLASSPTLASWSLLSGIPEGDIGAEHFFLDENATAAAMFYRILIED